MNCEIQIAETKGPLGSESGEALTVGRPFGFRCIGEWPELNIEKLELRLEAQDARKLKLLKWQKINGGEAQLLVTSYVPGEHKLKAVQLVDPDHSVVLGDLSITVKSVIDPQNPPKEPFGPMGPISISLPLWFWLLLVVGLSIIGGIFGFRFWRHRRRQRWMSEMKLSEKVLSPMAELSKFLRWVQKDLNQGAVEIGNLERAYRIYLARVFMIPALQLSVRQIVNEIKKVNRTLHRDQGTQIYKCLTELIRSKTSVASQSKDLSAKDFEQVIQIVRKSAEEIERVRG